MLHVDTCCNCLANKTWINRTFMAYYGLIWNSQTECGESRLNLPLWETTPLRLDPKRKAATQKLPKLSDPNMTPSTCATCVKLKFWLDHGEVCSTFSKTLLLNLFAQAWAMEVDMGHDHWWQNRKFPQHIAAKRSDSHDIHTPSRIKSIHSIESSISLTVI